MTATTPPSGEWFDAIATWSAARRRLAAIAAVVFALGTFAALVPFLVVAAPPNAAAAPMPAWDVRQFLAGEWLRQFERHCKESAWITVGLREVHDGLLLRAGLMPPPMTMGRCHYESAEGEELDGPRMVAAVQRGFLIDLQWPGPRPRPMLGPEQNFFLRYSDHAFLRRPWFDEKGRVSLQTNRFAMRDRVDLQEQKPDGETRVLCLGDSITMGWGVPEDLGWTRQLEGDLRLRRPELRVLNAGGVGSICVDEYHAALKNRWHSFGPDAVVVATSVNDLMPSNGLAVFVPDEPLQGVALQGNRRSGPLDLDPKIDWAAKIRGLDRATCEARGLTGFDRPWDAMWDRGVPQTELLAMRDWCRARGVAFVVAMWPLLQGLGPGRTYPFLSLHAEVGAYCAANDIPFVDLLLLLRDIPQEELWVTPADMHPNPRAHALAAKAIAARLEPLLRR